MIPAPQPRGGVQAAGWDEVLTRAPTPSGEPTPQPGPPPPAKHRTRPQVLLLTEGTYPDSVGGVSSWCDLIVRNLADMDWHVLPIVAGGAIAPAFALPDNARLAGRIELWSETLPAGRRRGHRPSVVVNTPEVLVRELIGWEGDLGALTETLVRCRHDPAGVRRVFRSRAGWTGFVKGLRRVLGEQNPNAGTPPAIDVTEAAFLFQVLYWVARTAAADTPRVDIVHVTAAGWAAIPALVHKHLYGTPVVLTEHGVYVREAYLAAVRSGNSPGSRFIATRLARGLARAAYDAADVVSPVTEANAAWETGLGVAREKIVVLRNGFTATSPPTAPPGQSIVTSVGRIDPLKDVHTMLRVARETLARVPDATFRHFGPVTAGEEAYARSCRVLHETLGLGDRFRFMGATNDPAGAVRASDVVLMTSISEGLPMAILEAMAEGRPVVATGVGGVPDVVKGCGVVVPSGDVHALTMGLTTLLRDTNLAGQLGRRGFSRLHRVFDQSACVEGYRELLRGLSGKTVEALRSAA
jgi:polysaccharide biosynthesis protein PelF